MKCKQRHKNGVPCKYEADNGSQFCYAHNPDLLPLFFVEDVDNYKRNDLELNLPIEKCKRYIDDGFAVQVSYAFRVRMEKTMLRILKKYLKISLADIKSYIADNDEDSLTKFFGASLKNDRKKISKFINKEDFNHKERAYLKRFVGNRRLQDL